MPSRFPFLPLKRLADIRPSGVDKNVDADERPVRLCNYLDVYRNSRINTRMSFSAGSATDAEIERFALRSGDVLITKDSEIPDDIAVPALVEDGASDLVCGYHLALLRPDPARIHGAFLYYALASDIVRSQFSVRAQGITRFGVTVSGIGAVLCPLPPLDAQRAIADFLDRETGRIDALIAKKERLVEILEERRTSFTEELLTKGLDKPEFKDSGIDWIGPMPADWQLYRLGNLAESLQTGPFGSQLHFSDYVDGGTPVINPSHLVRGGIVSDPACSVNSDTLLRLARHRLGPGDIILARRGELGRCALVTATEAGWLCGTGCLRLRPRRDVVIPEFLALVLSTRGVAEWLKLHSVGSTMDNLNTAILAGVPIPAPPVDEQWALLKRLHDDVTKLDGIRDRTMQSVVKLRELRSSLITAAVTGQIDVATWRRRGETERAIESVGRSL
jgi:type I restriction enzyme S subunit